MGYKRTSMAGDRKRAAPPRVKTVIAFSAMIILMVCIFITFQASQLYQVALEDGRANSKRLTQIMGDQVQLTFIAVDLTLRRAVERHYFNQLFGNTLRDDVEHNLRLWVDETPQIAGMLVLDPEGITRIAAFKQGYQSRIAYRESFKTHPLFKHLAEDKGNFAIAAQASEGGNVILLGREITLLSGEFGGVVIAMIDPQHFARFFESVDSGKHRFMSLVQQDGSILFSGPSQNNLDQARIIEQIRDEHLMTKNAESGMVTQIQSMFDRIQIFSHMKLKNLPIHLVVTIDEEDFLREWRHARIKDVSFLAIFTVFGSVLSYFALTMAKQISRIEESEAAAILASQAKSEFLANMSHELRTPLNAIIGFSEMINAGYFGDLTDKQRERIHDIHLCGTHLLQLISDILEFSKGEAGKLELYDEETNLLESMDECKRIISEKTSGKRIALSVEADGALPLMQLDKRKIRQILLNLLSNAVKFTPEGGSITLSARLDRSGNMVIAVADTGIGIPEEDIQKALSVFGQVHRNQSHEGTGLGLPLCKMFAELHGGRLTLTSKVGQGTTVTITLPADRVIRPKA